MMFEPVDLNTSLQYVLYNAPYRKIKETLAGSTLLQDLLNLQSFDKNDPGIKRAILLNMEKHRYLIESGDNKVVLSSTNSVDNGNARSYIDNYESKSYTIGELDESIASVSNLAPIADATLAQVISKLGERLKKVYIEEQKRHLHFYSRYRVSKLSSKINCSVGKPVQRRM